jgi:xanthine/uracil permease
MTLLFALPLLIGIVGLIAWIGVTALARTSDQYAHLDPERRFGSRGRLALAFILGFGMTGISALYAGWAGWLSLAAGLVGGVVLAAVAGWITTGDES